MNSHRSVVAGIGFVLAVKVGFQLAIATDLLHANWGIIARRMGGSHVRFFPCSLGELPTQDPLALERGGGVVRLAACASVWGLGDPCQRDRASDRVVGFPLEAARAASSGITITFVVLIVGRKFISVAAYSRHRPPTPPLQATTDTAASD